MKLAIKSEREHLRKMRPPPVAWGALLSDSADQTRGSRLVAAAPCSVQHRRPAAPALPLLPIPSRGPAAPCVHTLAPNIALALRLSRRAPRRLGVQHTRPVLRIRMHVTAMTLQANAIRSFRINARVTCAPRPRSYSARSRMERSADLPRSGGGVRSRPCSQSSATNAAAFANISNARGRRSKQRSNGTHTWGCDCPITRGGS